PAFAWNALPLSGNEISKSQNDGKSILDSIFDGFLWGVPKWRVPVERRLTRKHGSDNWGPHAQKLLKVKKNIVTCNQCGHFHESHCICAVCYQKTKEETLLVQEAMVKEFKLDAVDMEVVVRYEDDEKDVVNDKRLVEIPKKRPQFFSRNLLSKAISEPSMKSVIPEEKQAKFK
ncbi:39S ribosomal protein L32-like protein, partial [Leptotrombidium deliense]